MQLGLWKHTSQIAAQGPSKAHCPQTSHEPVKSQVGGGGSVVVVLVVQLLVLVVQLLVLVVPVVVPPPVPLELAVDPPRPNSVLSS